MANRQRHDWDLMVRRRAPVPLIAAALLLSAWVATAESGSITAVKCKADHAELIEAIETNRKKAIVAVNAEIEMAQSEEIIQHLEAQRERIWDYEESQRGRAQHILNDCLHAVRRRN